MIEKDNGGLVGSVMAGFITAWHNGGSRMESVSSTINRVILGDASIVCRDVMIIASDTSLYHCCIFFSEGPNLYALHFCNLHS